MRTIALVYLVIVCTSCNDNAHVNTEKIKQTDSTKNEQIDTTIEANDPNAVAKFESNVSFGDFKVNSLYTGNKAVVNVRSTKTSFSYRTRIREEYAQGDLNFAGHYCFIVIGCGSPCQLSFIVDLKTGRVYDGPYAGNDYSFEKTSRMLYVNPPDEQGYYLINRPYCIPEIWIWNENQKKFYQYDVKKQ